jgi:hypothetical protein
LLRHDGLSIGLGWAVYDYSGTQTLPSNTIPCMAFNLLMPLLLLTVLLLSFSLCGIAAKVSQKTMEVVLKEEAGVNIPDLTKLLKKPESYNGLEEVGKVGAGFTNLTTKLSNVQIPSGIKSSSTLVKRPMSFPKITKI